MKTVLKLMLGLALAAMVSGAAIAQDATKRAQFNQVELTDAVMKKYLAAQKSLVKLGDEIDAADDSKAAELNKKLTEIAVANGFESFEQFDDVASTISLVLEGLDPDSKEYVDPKQTIAGDIEDAKADTTLSDKERADVVADLEEARRTLPDLKHPKNIDVVRKYAEEIEKVLE